jgi:hypothetical protein
MVTESEREDGGEDGEWIGVKVGERRFLSEIRLEYFFW